MCFFCILFRDLLGDHATVRQYNVFPDNPNQADVDTEVILIAQNREISGISDHRGGEASISHYPKLSNFPPNLPQVFKA